MTSVALEDIWDVPLEETPRRVPSRPSSPIDLTTGDSPRRASKRPRSTLFLGSDSEDERPARRSVPPPVEKSEIDAMFDNLDAEPDAVDDLPPALDLDALRRQEDAKNAQIYGKPSALDLDTPSTTGDVGSSGKAAGSEKEKQKRRPLPKLDEARLLGPDGMPALLKQAKNFKPKGKGHEATDLNRLLQVYQYWTHKMFPKTPFRETVTRVEKLCHSKRMHVALTVWRDEYKGINTGHKVDPGSDESSSDEEGAEPKLDATGVPDGSEVPDAEQASSRPSSHPPSSEPPSSDGFDDFDIDAMIREEEERRAAEESSTRIDIGRNSVPQPKSAAQDDDDAMWDALDEGASHTPGPAPAQYASISSHAGLPPDEDEDMWDVIREMEADESSKVSVPWAPELTEQLGKASEESVAPAKPATNDEGWDEMYA
ncbi:Swi3-domain-containing protein [Daedalea quercina L-15889]|uniref:Chromosome segregation in meiosis protein n=1 Tax=Daedalea quercina L-15889 TaxID=1314783 RepID=A0A165R131_9APHY|nr:Swi3-domain-containing protein [Daedalea quercina L-15889]